MSHTDPAADARAAREALEREPGIERLDMPAGYLDRLERFVGLLLEANARVNLTRVVEPGAVARLHLLDALAALPILDQSPPDVVLDLGSGGGVPGIVLALARPSMAWTLVDSVRKKADALQAFVDDLDLANVTVVADRAELIGRDPRRREAHDLVTARACAPLPVLAEYAMPLLHTGGTLLAWKGRMEAAELRAGQEAMALLGGGEVSVLPSGFEALGDHRFVLVPKVSATPMRYPRRPGEPARRPLG